MTLAEDLLPWINLSHALAWHGTAQTGANPNVKTYLTPDEPGLVSALLNSQIQKGMETELQKHAQNSQVRIDSIFTHKTPTVRLGNKTPVEIGDLLLVRQHFDQQSLSTQGKALLLQAKRNTQPHSGSISSGNPQTQFELYRDWAPFEGVTRLPKGPWKFTPQGGFGEYLAVFDGQAHAFNPPSTLGAEMPGLNASNYPALGLFKSTWANGPVAAHDTASNGVQCQENFASTLARFFEGHAGVSFNPGSISHVNDWSDFVNTMLWVATQTQYTFISKRTNVHTSTDRGRTISTFASIQALLNLAFLPQVRQYAPRTDEQGIPDFMREPHFFKLAHDGSEFVKELYAMDQQIRARLAEEPVAYEGDDIGPPMPPGRLDLPDSDGGHVPVLLISSVGPGALGEPPVE